MSLPHSRRYPLGALIALFVMLVVLFSAPIVSPTLEYYLLGCAVGVVVLVIGFFVMISTMTARVIGLQCPACAGYTLHRLARFRDYYHCSRCSSKFKHVWQKKWIEATEPDDLAKYEAGSVKSRWRGYSPPVDPSDTTSGRLLQGMRKRKEEVGLDEGLSE